MTPDGYQKCKSLIKTCEGYKRFVYKDTQGHNTAGYGRNLDTVGVSEPEALYLLENDQKYHIIACTKSFPFFDALNDPRQAVLINMSYNLGHQTLLKFTKMILALESQDYEKAADEMRDSTWYDQVAHRADILIAMMRTGEWE